VIYVGETGEKWAYFDADALRNLGVVVDEHGKMPDVVIICKRSSELFRMLRVPPKHKMHNTNGGH